MDKLKPEYTDEHGRLKPEIRDRIIQAFRADGWQDWMREYRTAIPIEYDREIFYRKNDNSAIIQGMDSCIPNIGWMFRSVYGEFDDGPYDSENWYEVDINEITILCAQCDSPFPYFVRPDYLCSDCRSCLK